ncbi:Amino acid transporter ANTL1, partial [Armadillidium nasatum]
INDGIHLEKSTAVEGGTELRKGMNYLITSCFLIAQMAGAGFLALPSAFADTGWLGLPMLIIFCISVAYSGTRLGHCWVILEERWPEYRKPARQPYMEIAYRSFGSTGRNVIMAAVLITLVGTSIVYIILIAQFLHALVTDVSLCLFTVVVSIVFIPFTWLGTPKDFWQASLLAGIATALSCLIIFVQLLLDIDSYYLPEDPFYRHATFQSFSLGFGSILFSFGGASAFPTIQNDMDDRSQFWKSVIIGFAGILIMYLPVAITGYTLLGYEVPGNILLYRRGDLTVALKIAISLEIVNLLGTFLIVFNPICQIGEEILNIPRKFGVKRMAFRTALIVFDLIVALGIPDFGLILNLVGGSTVTICSFLAPPAMYIKLVDDKSNPEWPQRIIPTWGRIFLYEIMLVGFVGGICSTGSAIYGIINSDFSTSCFADFPQENS